MGRRVITERNQQHTSLLLTVNTLAHVPGEERKQHKLIQSSEVVPAITFFRADTVQRCGEPSRASPSLLTPAPSKMSSHRSMSDLHPSRHSPQSFLMLLPPSS